MRKTKKNKRAFALLSHICHLTKTFLPTISLAIFFLVSNLISAHATEIEKTKTECEKLYGSLHSSNTSLKIAIGGSVALHAGVLGLMQTKPELFKNKNEPGNIAQENVGEKKEKSKDKIKLKTEEELIAEAKENLKSWKEKKKLKTSLVDFLIHAEIERTPEEYQSTRFTALSDFKKNIGEDLKGLADSKNIFKDFREKILAKYIKIYCEKNALYTDYVENGCGNCEAQTKFVTAHLLESQIAPPPGMEFGIQIFSDHIQPVFFDRKRKLVMELISGKATESVIAPIYSPAFIHCGYLQGKNANIENFKCPEDTLLLSGPKLNDSGKDSGSNTNSKMNFQVKEKIPAYGNGNNTARAELNFDELAKLSKWTRPKIEVVCLEKSAKPNAYSFSFKHRIEVSDFDFLYSNNLHSNYDYEVDEIGISGSNRRKKSPTIFLREQEDCERMKNASTDAEKIRLAQQISTEEMNKLLSSEKLEKLLLLIQELNLNPEKSFTELLKIYSPGKKYKKRNQKPSPIDEIESSTSRMARRAGALNLEESFIKELNHFDYLYQLFQLGDNPLSKPRRPIKLQYLSDQREKSIAKMKNNGLEWIQLFSEQTVDTVGDFYSALDTIATNHFDFLFPFKKGPVVFARISNSAIHSLAPYFFNPDIVQIRETANLATGKADGKINGKHIDHQEGTKSGLETNLKPKDKPIDESQSANDSAHTTLDATKFNPNGQKPLVIRMQIVSPKEKIAKQGKENPFTIETPSRPYLLDYGVIMELLESENSNCCNLDENGIMPKDYYVSKWQRLDQATIAYENFLHKEEKKRNSNFSVLDSNLRAIYAYQENFFFSDVFISFFNNENNRKRLGYNSGLVKIRYQPKPDLKVVEGKLVEVPKPEKIYGPYPKELAEFIVNSTKNGTAAILD